MMRPTLAFLEDPKVENPVSAPGKWYLENTGHRFVDGLFTAPPLLAMLYQMTGDEKYVDWMDTCFWDVHKEIYDHDAGLFLPGRAFHTLGRRGTGKKCCGPGATGGRSAG